MSQGIFILSSQGVGIVHPVAAFRVDLARFLTPAVLSGLCKAGLPLTQSLNPGIAFARSNFSDITRPEFVAEKLQSVSINGSDITGIDFK